MSYRIEQDESVQDAVQRIAREQIDRAIGEIEDDSLDQPETVHQVRKRCKKIRGLIRLVRPQFEQTYQAENAWYRDAARAISYVRDAQTVVKTFEDLLEAYADQIDPDAFDAVRDPLYAQRDAVYTQSDELEKQLDLFSARMREGRSRIDGWTLDADGFEAIGGGLAKTYGRGRKAMRVAYDAQTSEAFHEWRKRVKYHWYHARLLESIWPELMHHYAKQAHQLADYLGDEHDLGVLRQMLTDEPVAYGGAPEDGDKTARQVCIGLIDQRRAVLQAAARPLGLRMFCESPKRLTKRMACYWDAWRCASNLSA